MALKHVALVENLFAKGLLRWWILLRNLTWFLFLVPVRTPHKLGECLPSTRSSLMLWHTL